jgi:LacI family transcriptional regulator
VTAASRTKRVPKYLVIKHELRERIARGDYGAGVPVPPERALAVELKAAPMTVRRAISELVDEGVLLRQRGRGKGTFVREVKGVPHAARSRDAGLRRMAVLHRRHPDTLRASPVYMVIFMEVQAECARNGVALEFLPVAETEGSSGILSRADESGARALLVLDWWRSEDLLDVQNSGLPVIVPGPFQETIPVSSVCANEYQGAFAATRHLVDLGHASVALVNSRKEIRTTVDRWGGWIAATGMNFEAAEKLTYRAGRPGAHSGHDFEEVVSDLTSQFRKRRPPSAIFARDGQFAHATMTALKQLGRSCPKDVSVACIGTFYEAMLGLPRMTAATVPDGALGRAVVRLAQDLVSGRQEAPVGILLPMQVVEGESARAHGRRSG